MIDRVWCNEKDIFDHIVGVVFGTPLNCSSERNGTKEFFERFQMRGEFFFFLISYWINTGSF